MLNFPNFWWVLSEKRVHSLLENIYLIQARQVYQINFFFLVALLRFSFGKVASKFRVSEFFSLQKKLWWLAEQGVIIPNVSETIQSSWSRSSEITVVLPLRDPLVVTFNETRAPTCKNYVAEQGIVIPN